MEGGDVPRRAAGDWEEEVMQSEECDDDGGYVEDADVEVKCSTYSSASTKQFEEFRNAQSSD